jgi:hypothetical protein
LLFAGRVQGDGNHNVYMKRGSIPGMACRYIYASSHQFTHIVATTIFYPRVTAAKAINNQSSVVVHAIARAVEDR